jgi:hypothetical protein
VKTKVFNLTIVALILGGFWNYFTLHRPITEVLIDPETAKQIEIRVHYQWLFNVNNIVLDLRRVSPEIKAARMTRLLVDVSKQLRNKSFSHLILAYDGDSKFMLDGRYVRDLADSPQSLLSIMSTMPPRVLNLEGDPVFRGANHGGISIVEELNDVDQFHSQWYGGSR